MSAEKRPRKGAKVIPLFEVGSRNPTEEFGQWLTDTGFPDDVTPAVRFLDTTLELLSGLRPNFRPTAWEPRDAHALLAAADSMADDSDTTGAMVSMSLAFLEFLDVTGRWTGDRDALTHCVEDLSKYLGEDPMPSVTLDDVELHSISPEDEYAALSSLKLVDQIRSLLTWIGKGRPITGTGVIRPALIADLAEAVGVELTDGNRAARSMRAIPRLMTLWDAATASGLIELTSTKAFRGPHAHEFAQSLIASLPATREAVSLVIGRYFPVDDALDLFASVKVLAAQIVLRSMTNEPPIELAPADPSLPAYTFEAEAGSALRALLRQFAVDGWLIADGLYRVPDPLRPAVLSALRSLDLFDADDRVVPITNGRPERLCVTVQLRGTDPPVWRKLEVEDDLTLDMVHELLQLAFGWENAHLHQFHSGPRGNITTYVPAESGHDARAEHSVTIGSLLRRPGDTLTYEYDFGDGWDHVITLDTIDEFDPKIAGARCVDGANMTPYEDSGGPMGWAYHLATAADPREENHKESRRWLGLEKGKNLDPTHFDLAAAQSAVGSLFMQRP